MKFGEKLKKARQEKGFSQEDLARMVGVSLRTIMNYENQNRYPKKREIYGKLAEETKIEFEENISTNGAIPSTNEKRTAFAILFSISDK